MAAKGIAPLKRVVGRQETTVKFLGLDLPAVIHTLECGHVLEPLIRGGCRVGNEPKRRRCKECQEKEEKTDG